MTMVSEQAYWIMIGIGFVLICGVIIAGINFFRAKRKSEFDKGQNETERQFLSDLKVAVDHKFKDEKYNLIKNEKRYYLEVGDTSYKIYRDKGKTFHFIDRGLKVKG